MKWLLRVRSPWARRRVSEGTCGHSPGRGAGHADEVVHGEGPPPDSRQANAASYPRERAGPEARKDGGGGRAPGGKGHRAAPGGGYRGHTERAARHGARRVGWLKEAGQFYGRAASLLRRHAATWRGYVQAAG